jgi:hypothetical protein
MTPDGSKLLAMLQDPLVNEGGNNDGRRSRNLRIVEFDTATGNSTRQFIYQLEPLADINARIPGTANDFGATAQGRNIGISAIIALNSTEFLVLERDNRGIGVDALVAGQVPPVGSKRVYRIDITGATDVSGVSLANTNTLPVGVNPVTKSTVPFIDIADFLTSAGQIIPEKFEGLTVGPRLNDGGFAILTGTDNDYSVTQNDTNIQFNVCSDANYGNVEQVALGDPCPNNKRLLPGFLYSFKASSTELGNFVPASTTVPESNTVMALLAVGFGSLMVRTSKE